MIETLRGGGLLWPGLCALGAACHGVASLVSARSADNGVSLGALAYGALLILGGSLAAQHTALSIYLQQRMAELQRPTFPTCGNSEGVIMGIYGERVPGVDEAGVLGETRTPDAVVFDLWIVPEQGVDPSSLFEAVAAAASRGECRDSDRYCIVGEVSLARAVPVDVTLTAGVANTTRTATVRTDGSPRVAPRD